MDMTSRKRSRADERTIRQQKYFITDRIMEKNDTKIMEEIYKKTLERMFAGARNQQNNKYKKSTKDENSMEETEVQDTVDDKFSSHSVGCKICLNDISELSNICCSNCNLKICDKCSDNNCVYCGKYLCVNCINLFGCLISNENGFATAICEECKSFI